MVSEWLMESGGVGSSLDVFLFFLFFCFFANVFFATLLIFHPRVYLALCRHSLTWGQRSRLDVGPACFLILGQARLGPRGNQGGGEDLPALLCAATLAALILLWPIQRRVPKACIHAW